MASNDQRGPAPTKLREEELEAEASHWIARRDHGLSPADQAELQAWLVSNPRHAQTFERCEAAWGCLRDLRHLPESELAALLPRPVRHWPWIAATGALAAALALGLFLRRPPVAPAPALADRHYTSAVGKRLILPDGSIAEMHRGSEIVFSNDPTERRVQLLRGEVLFDVVHQADRPFVVVAGAVAIQDLGTAFDVRLESDRVAVLVTEGRVVVSQTGIVGSSRLVRRGEQAEVRTQAVLAAIEIHRASIAEAQKALAWQEDRRLVFTRTSLAQAAAEMNLCNRCQLRVVDAKAGSVLISGSVDAGSIDAFVSLLSSRFGVSAENRSDDEIVLALAGRDRTASFEPPAPPVLADPSPRLVFSRTPLAEAVAQMNLYNRRKLVVADDATGSVLVSGRVEANNVDGFVSLLSIGFGVSAEGRGETETVLRK